MRTYIEPKVKLIDKTNYDLSYYVWLKSRRKVIRLKDGNPIDDVILGAVDDLYFDDPQYDIIFVKGDKYYILVDDNMNSRKDQYIREFYVDNELVKNQEYRKRIVNIMNLQYNNFPTYIFEITGSALFRDFLYNINWSDQWAESNRFLFSILPDDAVLDEKYYKISSEYKGVPEWEDQFTKYMNKIHETQITDENRTEMPYSISSFFWWGCNYKTLINVLMLMKVKFPFFYEVYGRLMMEQAGINESVVKDKVDYSLLQYFRCDDWKKGVIKHSGFYIINTEMSYIILSQFLRQSPSVISGLYSDLEHTDPEVFSHKVFKGDTLCKVTFVSHQGKLMSTVSKRSCNFAANSGYGPGSWSGFLNQFLESINSLDDFRELLPCTFDDKGLLKYCPLWDDVKFRNSGTESRNCVCPLTTCNADDADKKCARDNNMLSVLFKRLTLDMIAKGGTKYIHKV